MTFPTICKVGQSRSTSHQTNHTQPSAIHPVCTAHHLPTTSTPPDKSGGKGENCYLSSTSLTSFFSPWEWRVVREETMNRWYLSYAHGSFGCRGRTRGHAQQSRCGVARRVCSGGSKNMWLRALTLGLIVSLAWDLLHRKICAALSYRGNFLVVQFVV